MRTVGLVVFSMLAAAQAPNDQLSQNEIEAAVAARPNSGFVFIEDSGFTTPSRCPAQMPSVSIFTPSGWLNALSIRARRQYLPFKPDGEDTLRALTIISRGCASGSVAGPVCESITRVALLSDLGGSVVVEAAINKPVTNSWQNGFGASASCSSLVSKFMVSEVQKVRNKKGEFLVATFSGVQLLKVYTVKEKHLKQLGM
jgi:hypothetical protein